MDELVFDFGGAGYVSGIVAVVADLSEIDCDHVRTFVASTI